MPWNASQFKDKHFKKASGEQAKKASHMANAILKSGGDEGVAIATAIARAKGQKRKSRKPSAAKAIMSAKPL